MKRIKFLFITLICFFTISLVGCQIVNQGGSEEQPKTYTFSLSESEIVLKEGEEHQLTFKVTEGFNVTFEIENADVLKYENNTISALHEGSTLINFYIDGKLVGKTKVTVSAAPIIQIDYVISTSIDDLLENDKIVLEEGAEIDFSYNVTPEAEALVELTGDSVELGEGKIKAIKEGTSSIKIIVENTEKAFDVEVLKGEAPVISLKEGFENQLKASWNEEIDVLVGLEAIDNFDGDVTNRLNVVTSYKKQDYGISTAVIEVEDSTGHKATFEREVNVVWDYSVTFIGHAGCFYGLMNSEEAFLYAAEVLKYQAIECDLKQTSDGVFVMSHDDTFGDYTIASTPYSTFKDYEITKSRSSGYPQQNGSVVGSPYTTKLCTLERYLEICKENNITAVIELKSSKGITNTDQSRMQALMDVIEQCGMLNQVIFLGSQYNCLIWTREHNYEYIPCQYLVNSCENETYLNRCLEYDLDISINVTGDYSNSDEWLARYFEKGIKVSTYTFTQYVDYDLVQTWINKGVHYVTCDWHLMSNLNLPKENNEVEKYTVKFYDGETLLKETIVKQGRTAASPTDLKKDGYEFAGWDKPINDVQSDLEVYATWTMKEYTITYVANADKVTIVSWESKADFKAEFYGDFFDWIEENYNNISCITKSGNEYTISKNSVTVKFSSVDDIMASDIYDFEKTFSNLIYRPVTRNADDSCDIIPDENYFLNSKKYLEKYREIDAWLMNAINVGYPSYSKTYQPLSSGKIQVFFRMHQWFKGTNIAAFNTLPKKHVVESMGEVTLPTDHLVYTIESEFTLSEPSLEGKTFKGWFKDYDLTEEITSIEKGMSGNLTLYAKWE